MSSEIAAFYSYKTFLITGGTGFIGTSLVEKILRSCSDVAKIILIVRSKKYEDVSTRSKKYFDNPIFNKIKHEGNSTLLSKVHFIEGDIVKQNLGLKPEDRQMIINDVNIIVHCAATIKFTEELKLAIETNVKSVEQLICLAKRIKNLKALIHISTAFISSSSEYSFLQEEFISTGHVDYKYLLNLIVTESNETINKLCPKILGKYSNTYILTKNAAEQLIIDQKGGLPITVFRPGVVMSPVAEPIPGWTNSYGGLFGYAIGIQLGILRVFPRVSKFNGQFAPVDMCVNSILAIGWETANNPNNYHEVYNFSSNDCDIPLRQAYKIFSDYPIKKGIGNPWFIEMDCTLDQIRGYLHISHVLPAIIHDSSLMLRGEHPRFQKYAEMLNSLMAVTHYLQSTKSTFINNNIESLRKKLNKVDQTLFNMDIISVNWDKAFRDMALGVKKYLFNEEDDHLKPYNGSSKL